MVGLAYSSNAMQMELGKKILSAQKRTIKQLQKKL
jgi:hypothetical protein